MKRAWPVVVALGVLPLLSACSKDAAAVAERAAQHAKQGQRADAILEYRQSLGLNPRDANVRLALAKLYAANGDIVNAANEYVRAADLLPKNLDAQVNAGRALLIVGRYDDARVRAEKALQIQPQSTDAQILKGNALAGLKEFDQAVHQLEQAVAADPSSSAAYANLGALQFGRGDTTGALAAFKRAVALDQKAVPPRLALANYLWSMNRRPEAEDALKQALTIEPRNMLANRALALLYLGSGRSAEAEQPLKIFAEVAPKPDGMLALADYYGMTHRYGPAKETLRKAAAEPNGMVPATLRLASLGIMEGDRAGAYRLMDDVLRRDPKQLEALNGKTHLLIADGKLDDALQVARAAVAAWPSSPQAQYALASVLTARHQDADAADALKEALRLNPTFAPAQVDLGKQAFVKGKYDDAIQLAEGAIQSAPQYADAYLLLARSELGKKDTAHAEATLKKLEGGGLGETAVVQADLGRLYFVQGDRAKARAAFEKALAQDPSETDALQGLVAMDLQDKKPAAARERIAAAEKAAPKNISVKILAGTVYANTNDPAAAEKSLKEAIDLDRNNMSAYETLARLYLMQHRLPEATAEFEAISARQPKNPVPLTVAGVLLIIQNKPTDAAARFEKALQVDPRAAVAANNLAWMYATKNENLDVALELARTAKAELPNSHEVDDTLGMVYYKKRLSTLAIGAFADSVKQQPNNPSYVGHLGLAYAQNGQYDKARESLERALKLSPNFDGADEVRKTLETLSSNPAAVKNG